MKPKAKLHEKRNQIRKQAHTVLSIHEDVQRGFGNTKTECYVYFEAGKLHLMAIDYAKEDKALSDEDMTTLEEFDTFDDPVQYVLAIQILIFKLLNFTEYTAEEIKEKIKAYRIENITTY